MIKYTRGNETHKIILDVFKRINDLVVPTMGAKGRLAVLNAEFDKPTMTDDGVTVAKEARNFEGLERMVAVSMIEAAANTEAEAYDGTTLTVLLCYELYRWGYWEIKKGRHPQVVADELELLITEVRTRLKEQVIPVDSGELVQQVASVSTKMPILGSIVKEAFDIAGPGMNVVINHDREVEGICVEHTEGLSLDSGYMSDIMKAFCNNEAQDKSIFENAHAVLLKDGVATTGMIQSFFRSIPSDAVGDPFVFFVTPGFNPEAMKYLIETLTGSNMIFQFVFLNESMVEDVFLDLAVVTAGKLQDVTTGASDYTFDDCGIVKRISIEIDKCLIEYDKDLVGAELARRIARYEERLDKGKFKMSNAEEVIINRRLGSLKSGLVKIKIGVATIVEYKTLALKLDDAIGAVRMAIKHGAVIGGGKALYNIAKDIPHLKGVLKKPMQVILGNAGRRIPKKAKGLGSIGFDVKTNTVCDLLENGILDGFASVDLALKNAGSIACNYLRSYTLLMKDMSKK